MNTVFGFRHEENDGMYRVLVDFGMVEYLVISPIPPLVFSPLLGIFPPFQVSQHASANFPSLLGVFHLSTAPVFPPKLPGGPVHYIAPCPSCVAFPHSPGGWTALPGPYTPSPSLPQTVAPPRGLARPHDPPGLVAACATKLQRKTTTLFKKK
eukprot:Gb_37398 [translate_table: standard]